MKQFFHSNLLHRATNCKILPKALACESCKRLAPDKSQQAREPKASAICWANDKLAHPKAEAGKEEVKTPESYKYPFRGRDEPPRECTPDRSTPSGQRSRAALAAELRYPVVKKALRHRG
ncbi:MAG: hypothetical protein NTV57_17930, partial [Cyanobacteria bacterium]|nr:hypothetical protein [Cyanobacteriota bacterium]